MQAGREEKRGGDSPQALGPFGELSPPASPAAAEQRPAAALTLPQLEAQLAEQGRRLRQLEAQLREAKSYLPPTPASVGRLGVSEQAGRLVLPTPESPVESPTRSAKRIAIEADPFGSMFAKSKLAHGRMFDQELLMAIYEKPYQRMRNQAALFASGIMGLLLMPFGPIGMVGGALLGALCGTLAGALVDMRTVRLKIEDSQVEVKRLKSLLRWASERHTEEDEILNLIEMVTLEFKPISDIAPKSNNARKLLKLLDQWIAKKSVTRQIWLYMEQLLQRWRELPREQLLRSMLVLQTLTTMYHYSNRALDELEIQFLQRMERFLALESVQSVMIHAQQNVTLGESRVMESMVYADAMGTRHRVQDSDASPMRDFQNLDSGVSDDSDLEQGIISPGRRGGLSSQLSLIESEGCPMSPRPPRTMKKPFFRDWADFMDFDDTIKHKMPITLSEFELLLEKEGEGTTGWDVCVEKKDLKIAKIMSGPGVVTLRAWAVFPGVDLHTAFYLFYNFEERTKWDKTFCMMKVVADNCQGSDVVYCLMKIPTVTPRDFLQYRRVHVLEDGSILIMLRSAEHSAMPEDKNYIRVENKISGYILRQDYEDGKPVLRMFLMTCSDVKGMIPKWIINYLAPKKPAEWMDALNKAAKDYQAQHSSPSKKGELLALLQKFQVDNPWDFEPEVAASGSDGGAPPPPHRTQQPPVPLLPEGRPSKVSL